MRLKRRIGGGNLFIFSSFALLYFTLLQFKGIMYKTKAVRIICKRAWSPPYLSPYHNNFKSIPSIRQYSVKDDTVVDYHFLITQMLDFYWIL